MSNAPWFDAAKKYVGLKEIVGSRHEKQIVRFFAEAGHPEIHDDETAWCAAFVGAMLRQAGYKSTGALNARSYENFGEALDVPREGCIVVLKRGTGWQGHVGFYAGEVGARIKLLGGNQGNAVSIATFAWTAVLAYRWPVVRSGAVSAVKPAPAAEPQPATVAADDQVRGDPDVWHVQRRLKAMNYSPGERDGEWGGGTAGAISAFINDRHLRITPPTSAAAFAAALKPLQAGLAEAEAESFSRPIAPQRAMATPDQLAPKLPEVQAAMTAERVTFWGSIAAAFSTTVAGVSKFFGDAVEWLNPIKEFVGDLPWPVWVAGALILSGALYYISRKSGDAKNAATQAYQEGSRV